MSRVATSAAEVQVIKAMAMGRVALADPLLSSLLPEVTSDWIDTKEQPPEIGYIVKRWKNGSGFSFWAGYYSGDPKMASCDAWLKLPA